MSLWAVNTTADIALTGTTAKTVLGADAAADSIITMEAIHLAFESVTASDGPALIEIISAAEEGTATSATPVNLRRGHIAASPFAGFINHTVEPSTVTVVQQFEYPAQGSVDIPLPFPVDSAVGGFLGVRVTTPENQNCRGHMIVRA